ncbi:YDG domain-containing protein [Pseudomonas sp. PLMAX]|uniref:two-partner secretion domain-containing protein n=1 Tax=Pseudomonas sp. PLMAX TaxID=2201998 RepID=UPI0038B7DE0B
MNKIHNIIWSTARSCWVVVAEGTKSSSKSGAKALKVMLALLVFPAGAMAATLPQGGSITVGNGSIVTNGGNQMVIKQISDKLGINWQSFNVGPDGHVIFDQPGKDSIALNRVIGRDGSSILGKIDANGQVFLINPNGVIFGKGAEVNVGGLVASTLNISDEDFKNGNFKFKAEAGNGGILNEGSLQSAEGGYIALLGKTVSNNGVIKAKMGSAALAAGGAVTLDFSGDGLINIQVDETTMKALVSNKGLIQADGGSVLMTARASNALLDTVVNNEGVIQAQTINNKSGRIFLDGGMDSGTVAVAGTLDASAPATGNGGFIETSGANVKIADGTRISTLSKSGKTGRWLVDPTDFEISEGSAPQTASGIGNATLESALASTNVELQTSASGSEAGDITVNGKVAWAADTSLTLTAHNDIIVKQDISVNGTNGGLVLNHGDTSKVTGFQLKDDAKVNLAGANSSLTENGKSYIVLRTVADLDKISNLNPNDYFALGVDIDASSTHGANAGKGYITSSYNNIFAGVLDGLGHTIDNIYVNGRPNDYAALIGRTDGATIKNINITNAEINGDIASILVGDAKNTTVRNVNVSGKLTGESTAGVIGGANWGGLDMDDVHADVDLTSTWLGAGGLTGSISNAVIKNSSANVVIHGDGLAGGIASSMDAGTVLENVSSSGVIYSDDVKNGGLVANASDSQIKNSFSTIDIEGGTYNGGLIGYGYEVDLDNAYSTGNISGENSGGIAGTLSSSRVKNVFATGNITGNNSGGLVGEIRDGTTISNSYATGDVTGDNVGGLVGKAKNSAVEYSYSTGKVGALPPPPPPPTSEEIRAQFPEEFLNGIPGGFPDAALIMLLENFPDGFAPGVLDNILAGLLVDFPDGLPPGFPGPSGPPKPPGPPAGDPENGGLIGSGSGNTVTNSFWDVEKSGQTTSAGGVGKTTAEMHSAATFAGWDIGTQGGTGEAWRIYDGFTGPMLRFAMTKATVDGSDKNLTYNAKDVTQGDLNADSPYGHSTSLERDPYWNTWGSDSTADLDAKYILGGNTTNGGKAIRNAGTYTADQFYSTQFGYDIVETGTKTITVDKAALDITGSSTASKIYDGSRDANVSLDFTALGDDVLTAKVDAKFDDKNAGAGKNVTISGITLEGDAANNYYVASAPTTSTGTIDKATLNVGGIGHDKVYDGSTSAGVSLTDDRIAGDDLTLSGSGSFADKNAGAGKVVTIDGITVSGADAQNYVWNGVTTATATISKALLNVFADAKDKIYDGSTNAQVTLGDDRIAGDDLVANFGSSSFSDKNAGTGKTVTVGGITLSGADADNYAFNTTATSQADIAKANLVIKADNASKVEGSADGHLSWNVQSGNLFGSDSIDGSLARDAGEDVGLYAINQGDLTAGSNYELSVVPGEFEITEMVKPPVVVDPIEPPVVVDPIEPPVVVPPKPPVNEELEHTKEIVSSIIVAAKVSNSTAATDALPKEDAGGVKGDYRLLNLGMKMPDDLTSENGATY